VVIKGHGRLLAAKALKLTEVPVIVRDDLTPQQVKASRIADNKVSQLTIMDDEMLLLEIEELEMFEDDFDAFTDGFSADLIGFDDMGVMDLKAEDEAREAKKEAEEREKAGLDGDSMPEMDETDTITELGDVYVLGNHRLLCGSSTEQSSIDSLLGEELVDQLLTDPPYGVDYGGKGDFLEEWDGRKSKIDKIDNDTSEEIEDYEQFFVDFISLINFSHYNTIYLSMSSSIMHSVYNAFTRCKVKWGEYLVWVKNSAVICRKDYNMKHELIAYGWKGVHKFHGEANRTTVLEYNRPTKSKLHPTMKPVELFKQCVTDGTKAGAIVYDAFGGSGTTLIACEETGRKARLCELSPKYCDVIVKRWEDLTGKTAQRYSKQAWEEKGGQDDN